MKVGTLGVCIALELLLATLLPGVLQSATRSDPPQFKEPFLAHWTFDSPSSAFASPNVTATRGIHGQALHLQQTHALKVHLNLTNAHLEQITFSAWVRPMELSSYREIFRQECSQRLLFSFQEHGAILSLGLNIGGYLECDAQIHPEKVLDGRWHHCAATFDGHWMRVYLDGREIGSLARVGRISIANNVPGFIGSSGGTGEHFQGDLDELRIYSAALSADQINALFQAGVAAVEAFAREMEIALREFYPSGKPFAETLLHLRKKSVDVSGKSASDLLQAAHTKLKSSFSKEHDDFFAWTGIRPLDYLKSANSRLERELASRLMDLLLRVQTFD